MITQSEREALVNRLAVIPAFSDRQDARIMADILLKFMRTPNPLAANNAESENGGEGFCHCGRPLIDGWCSGCNQSADTCDCADAPEAVTPDREPIGPGICDGCGESGVQLYACDGSPVSGAAMCEKCASAWIIWFR